MVYCVHAIIENMYMYFLFADGKLPDLTPDMEKQFQDELQRAKRIYGGGDMSQFPKFNFVDNAPSEE